MKKRHQKCREVKKTLSINYASSSLLSIFPHSKTINRENKILLLHILGHYFLNTNLSNSIKCKQELCMEKEETISS